MNKAAIGVGSNLGDSVRICRDVFNLLRNHPAVDSVRMSSLYRTSPVGSEAGGWFINAAMLLETLLEPLPLLDLMLDIESRFGRVRTIKWGPRTLDLDLLFYEDRQIDLPRLKAPHPLMGERLFVLMPLAEIEPDWIHPGTGRSVREMLALLLKTDHGQQIEKLEK
ncbi:MAG: 2-amino-4-hydroxy-6-hydroxymethyldihydropteridine diphosphokinase [Syntrophobacteraceae bacterium]|nr:2-amino-4-hydroxy-6-hydroxymethyldihydropteridine diphosphokinase [Syntrophobacteraceae bacterium]